MRLTFNRLRVALLASVQRGLGCLCECALYSGPGLNGAVAIDNLALKDFCPQDVLNLLIINVNSRRDSL